MNKKDKIIELTSSIVQNMKYADKHPHLKYAYYAQITEDNYRLTKLVGSKKAKKLIKEAYEEWTD